jgi:MGT family glycosyltransferase
VCELPAVQPLRPAAALPAGRDVRGPSWLDDLPQDRTVYVSFGTVWNRDPGAFGFVLDALAGETLEIVVTVGATLDASALGPRPANVHIASFIPQALILPRCAAVLCHGGSGTVLGALGHGRPVLVLPQGADHFANGASVMTAGAGRMLHAGELSAEALREAVRALLDEPSYRRAARAVAAEIAAMPEPETAVDALKALL